MSNELVWRNSFFSRFILFIFSLFPFIMNILVIVLPFLEDKDKLVNTILLMIGGFSVFIPLTMFSGYQFIMSLKTISVNNEGIRYGSKFYPWSEFKTVFYEKENFSPGLVFVRNDESRLELYFMYSGKSSLRFMSSIKSIALRNMNEGEQKHFMLSFANRLAIKFLPVIMIFPIVFALIPWLVKQYMAGQIPRLYLSLSLIGLISLIYFFLTLYRILMRTYIIDEDALKVMTGKKLTESISYDSIIDLILFKNSGMSLLMIKTANKTMRIYSQIGNLESLEKSLRKRVFKDTS
ncbi:MAG: hypothetical protein JXA60_05950 [Candidatus Coatesbacteria bacterium]|nr:hypothetical protein [Candidatus Coatesbacteria bacterium]